MKTQIEKKQIILAFVLFAVTVVSRLVPHPWNFTALGAVSIFAGSWFSGDGKRLNKIFAGVVIPLTALFVSDLVLGFHGVMAYVYSAVFFTALLGSYSVVKDSVASLFGNGLMASLVFYVVTNFGVWMQGGTYSPDFKGLMNCYEMALPFFGYQLGGDIFYLAVFVAITAILRQDKKQLA